ncbi:MAG TPA: hypothetical protein PLU93_10310, partial [Treponemataceae bacterium]|nr:hypothetical protein [Treponemataceae bacterium]
KSVDENTKRLVLFDSDATGYQIMSIQNLDALPKLESLEIDNASMITDFSFLTKAKSLKELYLISVTVRSLKFLENMHSLVKISLLIYIPDDEVRSFISEQVDMRQLTSLKVISFCTHGQVPFPPFVNVMNRPYLSLRNNQIQDIPVGCIDNLKQYSWIDFLYNPIKPVNLRRYGINTRFLETDNVPSDVLRWFED